MPRHHIINSLHIIGLIVITVIFAFIVGMFLPKKSQAPAVDPVSYNKSAPTPAPAIPLREIIQFNDIIENNRINPKQTITGTVPGTWFFEGSFPVYLKTSSGETFTTVIAKTNEDWMVTKNVSFSVTLPDEFSYSGIGTLLFTQDDPSDGESGREIQQKIVPVIFESN
jgi:hypothetical protein